MKSASLFSALLIFGALALPLAAQDAPAMPTDYIGPKAVITPETEGVDLAYDIGDIGWVSSTGADFETIKWDLSKAPAGAKIVNNFAVQFPTKIVGRGYSITQIVAKVNPVTKKPDIDFTVFIFDIGPNAPPVIVPDVPPIDPTTPTKPPVTPAPVADPFKAAMISITAKYAAIPLTEKPKVAAAFRSVVADIGSGKLSTRPAMYKATSEAIIKQIGLNAYEANWIEWRDDMVGSLRDLKYAYGPDYAKHWTTVADVLEGK